MELINPQLNNLITYIVIFAGLAISTWCIIGLYGMRNRNSEDDKPKEDFQPDAHESGTGVPTVLKLFYAFIALSMILYVLYIRIEGISY
ncbi:MAG: hypothetical protein ACYC0V_17265 [Armatimonadota bacterium]